MKIFLIIFQSDEEDVRNQLIGRIKGFGTRDLLITNQLLYRLSYSSKGTVLII